jgi:hypothetical protein
MSSLNDLECRTKKLETLLLPERDFLPDVYDFLIMAEMSTTARTEAEAVEIYGDKETWLNDRRTD